MKMRAALFVALALIALEIPLVTAADPPDSDGASDGELFQTISALDSAAFAAFNDCAAPGLLEKYASYFVPDVEFYHDTGGVTWNRKAMIANTGKNVCGHFRRELVADSLRVYPIKDFGAIEQGTHRFCQFKSGKCEGIADFLIVWRHQKGK